ncbi:MAG: rRNA maturation RNase YbeY [Acidobacteriota bacterium]
MDRREVRLHSRLRKPPLPKEALVSFALDAMSRLGVTGEVGVRFCSDRFMAEANRRYRGKKGPTDVLSFPSGEPAEEGGIYLGDILIAVPVAVRAARAAGQPLETELRRLLLHGLLHLLGYDHETDGGVMERKERRLRREWGIA